MAFTAWGPTPMINGYLGSYPLKALYVGDKQVYPSTTIHQENFDTALANGQWSNFVMQQNGEGARQTSGRAGMLQLGSGGDYITTGYYTKAGLQGDSHFCDIVLGSPIYGTLSGSHQPLHIYMRRQTSSFTGKQLEFRFEPGGDFFIYTWNGSVYNQRASTLANSFTVGQTMRFITKANGYCAAYNLTADPLCQFPKVNWTDTNKSLLEYNNPAYRYWGMRQETSYPLLDKQYTCWSADNMVYGDLPMNAVMDAEILIGTQYGDDGEVGTLGDSVPGNLGALKTKRPPPRKGKKR